MRCARMFYKFYLCFVTQEVDALDKVSWYIINSMNMTNNKRIFSN